MPSRSGGLLVAKFEALLRRSLTADEVVKCEELAANSFVGGLLTYIERAAKRPVQHTFDVVALALHNGIVKNASRGARKVEFTGRLLQVYKKLDLYKPDMTDGEMQAVIMLADKFTDAAIDRAIVAARMRGVKHVRYVLQICLGNEDKPTVTKTKTQIKPTEINPTQSVVSSSWERSLEGAEERRALNEIERMVHRHD